MTERAKKLLLLYYEQSKKNRTIQGSPPLTFKGKGKDLKNYRIYGNTVNGENVGDLITEGEHAGEYSVPVTVTNGTDTETTNLYLPEQIKMVGDEAEYVDYKEQKQHRVRKNLLQNTATSLTTYGVTITVNDDGSVTCNGTATSTIVFSIFEKELGQNIYILSGCPENGAQNERYKMQINPGDGWYADIGNGLEFEIQNTSTIKVRLVIYPPYTCNNLTFYPMIRKADIEDDTYEPYIEDTELDVTLPALPTLSGTNTLTVGTEVQPSSVEIKGRIKAAGGD